MRSFTVYKARRFQCHHHTIRITSNSFASVRSAVNTGSLNKRKQFSNCLLGNVGVYRGLPARRTSGAALQGGGTLATAVR